MKNERIAIEKILQRTHYAVECGHYSVALNENRKKNLNFIAEYGIRSSRIVDILLELRLEDFAYQTRNTKIGYEEEILYIFAPNVKLYPAGDDAARDVVVYIKINIIEKSVDDYVIVISFHEAEHEIEYAYK